jgi:hypothetical protein
VEAKSTRARSTMPRKPTIILLLALTVGACTDARGFNAFEAACVDQYQLQRATPEFQTCVARERQLFEFRFRAANPKPPA